MRRVMIAAMMLAMLLPAMELHAEEGEVLAVIETRNGMENALEICEAPPVESEVEIPEKPAVYKDIQVSEEELKLLRSILALEADYDTEGHDGQKAVVEVIFNRVLSDKWPDTVEDVIYQRGQFATVKYLRKPYNLPGEHEDDAISAVLRETETVLPDTRYVFFDTRGVNGRGHVRINHHVFGR